MNSTASNEPPVNLTENAAAEIQSMLTSKPEHAGKLLRLYVETGGCSGMQYGMVFDEFRDGDHRIGTCGVEILVDAFSLDYLRGTEVDFVDALTGGGFKIRNPNAKQSCGCGRSFET